MLSHQVPNIDMRRHQQHRRQKSTPAIFEAPQSSMNPGTPHRGMTVPSSGPHALVPQDHSQVSMTNFPGQAQPQHYLQVAQTQNHARPGHAPPPPPPAGQPIFTPELTEAQFRHLQHQQLDAHLDSLMRRKTGLNQNKNLEQHIHQIERSHSNPENYHGLQLVSDPHNAKAIMGMLPQNQQFPEQPRPSSSRSAGYNDDRFSLHPTPANPSQRPQTPPNQGNLGYSPMTPATTPFHAQSAHSSLACSTSVPFDAMIESQVTDLAGQQAHGSHLVDTDQEMRDADATIRAQRRPQPTRIVSLTDFFNDAAAAEGLPSPPQTQAVQHGRTVDMVAVGVSLNDVPKLELQPPPFFGHAQFVESPQHGPLDGMGMPMFTMDSDHSQRPSIDMSSQDSPLRGPVSPKNVPFDELSLEATIEDTGVSAEEVQSYIQDPTDDESKWTCLFPECGKKFGRKENIRSHVQTHLGDRQFKCVHCNKCFVRQHDLKRHSKIHSGVKPYPCICGNSFARHDALTRHRQRGICDGGFEGVVKRNVKRGRPRKERPDDDVRMNKSARTRERARDKTSNYASSVSGTSESSWADSPESAQDPFQFGVDGIDRFKLSLLSGEASGFAAEALANTPPMSPEDVTPAASPVRRVAEQSANTSISRITGAQAAHAELQEQLGSQSHDSQQGSQAGSPPGLSHSSPPSSAQMPGLDFDWGTSSGMVGDESAKAGAFGNDFDMFVNANGTEELFGGQWNDNALFSFDNKEAARDGMANDELFGDALNFAS